MMVTGSEYGGMPGIIQPDIDGVDAEAAAAGLGHASTEDRAVDRRGVRDAALIVRRAGIQHAKGVVVSSEITPEGDYTYVAYDEAAAREDYLSGNNKPHIGDAPGGIGGASAGM